MPSKHLTYANVTATLALFVALGGSSYAALKIGGEDVRDGSLTGRDVRDGSLAAADLGESATAARRRGRRGPRGRPGPQGPPGPPGGQGPTGPPGATNVVVRTSPVPPPVVPFPFGEGGGSFNFEVQAYCLPGEVATGGGIRMQDVEGQQRDATVVSTYPTPSPDRPPTGWAGVGRLTLLPGGDGVSLPLGYVVCARP
jgi:hypothetical protein